MIRTLAAARFALVLLCAAPMPALADVTARYALGGGKEVLLVEIDDGGNARIGIDKGFGLIRRDGVDYLVIDMKGDQLVTRLDDAIKVLKTQIATKSVVDDGTGPLFVLGGGPETQVSGFAATSWTLGPKEAGGKTLQIAISDDPELAPVGAMLRRLADSALSVFEGSVIPASSQFGPRVRELLAKGTPVQIAPLMELESVDHKEIDSHRFDLPGPVVSAEMLAQAIPSHAEPAGPLKPLP
ncbi:MAG: hypothetical protein ABW023_06785 [Sphingomonas sp.]